MPDSYAAGGGRPPALRRCWKSTGGPQGRLVEDLTPRGYATGPLSTPAPDHHVDNLTHGLVGAALARTGLDRRTPLATTTLVVAANAPDVDMLAFLEGEYAALAFRRGLTHGLPAMVVLPLVVTGAILVWDRHVRRRLEPGAEAARPAPVLALAALGLLTHPILDWMNTYGMRWWLPFDGRWSYGDALFIIDPWLWLVLGGAVALTGPRTRGAAVGWGGLATATTILILWAPVPAAARSLWLAGVAGLVAVWLRAGRSAVPRPRAPARRAGAAALAYVALMVLADRVARADVRGSAEAAGLSAAEAVMVAPLPADPLGADVVVRTPRGYRTGSHRWLRTPRAVFSDDPPRPLLAWGEGVDPDRVPAIRDAAWSAPEAADFEVWSRLPRMRIDTADGGYRVRISDMRYAGRGAGSLEGVVVHLSRELAVLGTEPP